MVQVVAQLQQEVLNLRAQVTAQSGLAVAVRAINNLATAQVRKDTPSLIDVKGLGRPKEFTGREEDFQQWSKAFFAGVIMESEMMLEWAAEQPKEITMTAIDLEFFPTESVLQQMHTALMALTIYEANHTVANSRKNSLEAWRTLQKRYKKTKPSAHWTVLSSGTSRGYRTLGVLRISLREEAEGQVRRRDQAGGP